MFYELLTNLPETLGDYYVAPRQEDRAYWTQLPEYIKAELRQQGKESKAQVWPSLPMSLYLQYTQQGNRINYEQPYFARRNQLNGLVLAQCVEDTDLYMNDILDAVFSICEESGWQLPAHNSYVRDQACDPLPKNNKPVVDLFSAETGAQLALVASLLEGGFRAIDTEITDRIQRELDTRIIQPYLQQHFWWMGKGGERMNNWTVWCTQNVLVTAFSRPFSQAIRKAVICKAALSLDAFMKDYGEDGASDEGAYYYHHAGLCLLSCLHILSRVAPAAYKGLWAKSKIKNIAEFIAYLQITPGRYFNYSDCPAEIEALGAREYIFAEQLQSVRLKDYAAGVWQQQTQHCLPKEISLLQRLQAIFVAADIDAYQHRSADKSGKIEDKFFPSIGLLVTQDVNFNLMVKAGSNDNSGHNHNDVGNLILYKNAKPLLIDVGCENYTSKTFSAQRYDIWTMQSAYHNLPTFNGVMQSNGAEYKATNIDVMLDENSASMVMDLASAYPVAAQINRYQRRVTFLKNQGIEIEDNVDFAAAMQNKGEVVLSLMFSVKPRVNIDEIVLPNFAHIALTGVDNIRLDILPIQDSRLLASWPDTLYRVLISTKQTKLTMSIQ